MRYFICLFRCNPARAGKRAPGSISAWYWERFPWLWGDGGPGARGKAYSFVLLPHPPQNRHLPLQVLVNNSSLPVQRYPQLTTQSPQGLTVIDACNYSLLQ